MKKLIMIMTVVAGVAALAACEAKQEAKADAAQVESLAALNPTFQEKRENSGIAGVFSLFG